MRFKSDLGVTQEIFTRAAGKRNALSLRFDILNLDNLINHNRDAGQRLVSSQPLIPRGADANGALLYRLRNIGTDLLWGVKLPEHRRHQRRVPMRLGVRYTFR